MKILLVYPKYPTTFWSFKYALKFISKKASLPPLGLLTVSAMLPKEWEQRLVDLNVKKLTDEDLAWADYVLISAMTIQKESALAAIKQCRAAGVKVIAGGPMFTANPEEFPAVDHLVLNEAEITLPLFLEDLKQGRPRRIYSSPQWADLNATPAPRFDLLAMGKYASMNIQYSRGCPFDCDFCNITVLYGRRPRTKSARQVLAELEELYSRGWRSSVFIVDDNFIGNKGKLKKEVLPAIIAWMEQHNYPFTLYTEVSINLADDEELMALMVRAGFDQVFIGIESPNEESLAECSKLQNRNRDLIASVRKIQQAGLEVQAGFIVGFDKDPAAIFDRLIGFIQESGIVTAMVGLLNAPQGTKLYHRMKQEGRLVRAASGDNTDFSINFVPKMSSEALLNGYRSVLQTIYSPKHYYARVKKFLNEFQPLHHRGFRLPPSYVMAGFKSAVRLGIIGRERYQYWKLFFWSLFCKPRLFPLAITFSIYGFHFRKVFAKHEKMLRQGTG
ncbi:MAG: B12-binding domain-containing radical SAM protein [Nitrospirae bacterium GWD2_57_9]|nr:MAG: B12-binding domain-containing radical SAM protein [Nitrospirae bacterium GWD2_57_9]